MVDDTLPKLRTLDLSTYHRDGRSFILVRDPLGISKTSLLIPQPLASAMLFCDGTRDLQSISAAVTLRGGVWIPPAELQNLLVVLDEQFLLENERFLNLQQEMLETYRRAPYKSSCCAGQVYPAEADALQQLLQSFMDQIDGNRRKTADWVEPSQWHGLISPHIDYDRGGLVYAQLWSQAKNLVEEAELVVILGTDHYGGKDFVTLTHQNYATPFGIIPTHQGVVNALATALGEKMVFAGELRHQSEHSVELAAVWLQFIRAYGSKANYQSRSTTPIEIVPVLTGSMTQIDGAPLSLGEDELLSRFIQTIKQATAGKRVLIVAAGDLSHVGPAFGGPPLDIVSRAMLKSSDDELLIKICAGDADGFFDSIRQMDDRNNVCGATPIYLTLRLLYPTRGEQTGYKMCLADEQGTSVVSICGVVFE